MLYRVTGSTLLKADKRCSEGVEESSDALFLVEVVTVFPDCRQARPLFHVSMVAANGLVLL